MFGYVLADAGKLTPEENRIYRGVYCGLCHALGSGHGVAGRLTVNYDMVFLVLLLSSVYGLGFDCELSRCPVHPVKKLNVLHNEITAYAADMNIVLSRYSMLDGWRDGGSVPRLCAAGLLKGEYRRVRSKYPRQCRALEASLSRLSALERQGCADPDAAADCFGEALAEVFIWQKDAMTDRLRAFGRALGRAIYIMDASADLKDDLKHRRYNPLAFVQGIDHRELICILMNECVSAYEKLRVKEDSGIFRNILYSGIWTVYDSAAARGREANGR